MAPADAAELERKRDDSSTDAGFAVRALYRRRMARVARSELPEYGVWHVTIRGVDGTPTYRARDDRLFFLARLEKETQREELVFYAICLMTNHNHFVVEAARDRLSAALHRLHGLYARVFNETYGRKGHLFGDRFWSGVIEDEHELRDTCVYVVYNPVRAGLCARPEEWPWSYSRYGFDLG